MADEWIKMRGCLQSSPKVVRILSALDADRFRVIGGLHAVWSIFDTHSLDGTLPGYTCEAVDALIGWPGFSRAMGSVGWLVVTPEGLSVPDFEAHLSKCAKRRAEDQKRKRETRRPKPVRNVSANSRTECGPESDQKEKEKEKKEETPQPPVGGQLATIPEPDAATFPAHLDTPEFRAVWADWEAERKAKRNTITPRARKQQIEKLSVLTVAQAIACVKESIGNGWHGLFPDKFRNGANGNRGAPMSRGEREAQYMADMLISALPKGGQSNDPGIF